MPASTNLKRWMSEIVIFDTSVLVDQLRTGRHSARIATVAGLIRMSSVVLAELWRGVRTAGERKIVESLQRNHPLLTPTRNHWIESGQILSRLRAGAGANAARLRDLHFDVLIALTARSCGARLITSNGADFQLIRRYRSFHLEVW